MSNGYGYGYISVLVRGVGARKKAKNVAEKRSVRAAFVDGGGAFLEGMI